jgi:hypothetical protein
MHGQSTEIIRRYVSSEPSPPENRARIINMRAAGTERMVSPGTSPKRPDAAALDSPKKARARTQIPGERVRLLYDSALMPVCGGVAPVLVFTWFEELFHSIPEGSPLTATSFGALYRALGMRQQLFSNSLRTLAVVYRGSRAYRLARIAGNPFYSHRIMRDAFYSLEITVPNGLTILQRNAGAINLALRVEQPRARLPISAPDCGPKALARRHFLLSTATTG